MNPPVLGEAICPVCTRLRPTIEKASYRLKAGVSTRIVTRVIADHQREPLTRVERFFLRLTGRDTTPKCEGSGQGVQS